MLNGFYGNGLLLGDQFDNIARHRVLRQPHTSPPRRVPRGVHESNDVRVYNNSHELRT